ncbi:YbaK/EbsC family protein, partial [Planococcus sp. SIMBA_143]
ANIEKAGCPVPEAKEIHSDREVEKVATPDVSTCSSLAEFLDITLEETTKTMIMRVDNDYVMILLRGDHELNDVKLKSHFGTDDID